jgi:hypothetical protein
MRGNRLRLHGLDISTKHVTDDSRDPEIKKPRYYGAVNRIIKFKSLKEP